MENIKIVVVDSGIDKSHAIFNNITITEFVYDEEKNDWKEDDKPVVNGHGTAIASVIVKNVDINNLISFRITDDEEVEPSRFVNALEYIESNIECDLINLSIGITLYSDELEFVCRQLNKKGIIIVSAFANEGNVSYPAAYDFVVGIDSTEYIKSFKEYIYVENSIVNIGCMRGVQRLAWLNGEYQLAVGNSFVTPLITARIASYLQNGIKSDEVWGALKRDADRVIKGQYIPQKEKNQENHIFKIRKAVIFPYNKETKNVVRFYDMLNFKLIKIFDSRYSGNIGLKTEVGNFVIEDIAQCDYCNFDTFIIGHLDMMQKRTGREYKKEIIEECLKRGIRIVSFDEDDILDSNELIYVPNIKRSQLTTDKFGKLYQIESPVFGIVGTSSQQGKFTLQLKLKKLFLENGYRIAQLSSEPEGCLFNADYVYPYGYNSNIAIEGKDCIEHVNALIHQMDINKPDIIMFGAQAGSCVLTFENTVMYNLSTIDFLLGANPDAVVMCVNYHDDEEDVVRAIKFVESLVNCKVVGISLFPMAFENKWKYMRNRKDRIDDIYLAKYAESLKKITGVPVCVLGNAEHEKHLFETLIDFFSRE